MTKSIIISPLLAVAVAMTSCGHKDIEWPESESQVINVVFDWTEASGANPDGMTLHFFSENGETRRFDIAGREGGAIELPRGKYRMIACNNDLPTLRFTGTDSFRTLKADMTREGDNSFLRPAGMLYGASISDISVLPCGLTYTSSAGECKECPYNVLRCRPDSLTTLYNLIATEVKGAERIVKGSATIAGVAPSMTVADGVVSGSPSKVGFPLVISSEENRLTGTAGAFAPEDPSRGVELSIAVTLLDGTIYQKKIDITRQVINPPYPRNVLILIKGLEIPGQGEPENPPEDVGNIDVDVEGWEEIEVDIITGV